MSLRDVEDLLAERGIDVTYEADRCWATKFEPAIAAKIQRRRGRRDCMWHLDEMVVRMRGKRMFMCRSVDKEGEVLDVVVQKRRNKASVLKLLRKLLKKQGFKPEKIAIDGLRSYEAAMRELGCVDRHHPERLQNNNRAENSHLPDRHGRCSVSNPKATRSASVQPIYDTFAIQRHLTSRKTMRDFRSAAFAEWTAASAAAG